MVAKNHETAHIQTTTKKSSQTVYVNEILWRDNVLAASLCAKDRSVSPMTIRHILRASAARYNYLKVNGK